MVLETSSSHLETNNLFCLETKLNPTRPSIYVNLLSLGDARLIRVLMAAPRSLLICGRDEHAKCKPDKLCPWDVSETDGHLWTDALQFAKLGSISGN